MPTEAKLEIRDDDRVWRELKARLGKAAESYAKSGVVGAKAQEQASDGAGGDLSVVDLAVVHEFGATIQHPGTPNGFGRGVPIPPHTIEIPERSFIRSAFDAARAKYEALAATLAGLIIDGKTDAKAALEIMGQQAASDVRERIRSDIPPPLAASTMRRKMKKTRAGGSDANPVALIDTGQLAQSISHQVVMRSGGAGGGAGSGSGGGGGAGGGSGASGSSGTGGSSG